LILSGSEKKRGEILRPMNRNLDDVKGGSKSKSKSKSESESGEGSFAALRMTRLGKKPRRKAKANSGAEAKANSSAHRQQRPVPQTGFPIMDGERRCGDCQEWKWPKPGSTESWSRSDLKVRATSRCALLGIGTDWQSMLQLAALAKGDGTQAKSSLCHRLYSLR
jgi:hypothetical protein